MTEQTISVNRENQEQTINVNSERGEQAVDVSREAVDITLNSDYDALENKPSINGVELQGNKSASDLGIVIPTNVSAFENDAGYLTEHQSLDGYAKTADLATVATSGDYGDLQNTPTIPTVPTKLSQFTDDLGSTPTHTHSQYLTEHQDISGKADAFSVGDGLDMTSQVLSNPQSIEYIVGTQTEATNLWTGSTTDSALRTGKIIAYYLPYAGTSSVAKLTLTLADGTQTSAIELRRTATSTVTTQFAAGNVIIMIYDGTYWKVSAYYDTNTNTIGYQLRTNSATLPMTDIVYRYRLLFTSADNAHFVPANKSTSTNATAKRDVITTPINPFAPIVYYGTTASVAAGSSPSAANLWQQYAITLGYSFNRTGAALVLDFPKPIYLKCAPQNDGSAIIDSSTPYVQTLPSTDDGQIYIYLGIAYSATSIELLLEHPIYQYKNGKICLYTG